MQLVRTYTDLDPEATQLLEQLTDFNLVAYASDAALEMGFRDKEELKTAIRRAMEACTHAGISVVGNFRRVYMCSAAGVVYDWKLSALAYRLVCLNGSPANPRVARLQVALLKNQLLNH